MVKRNTQTIRLTMSVFDHLVVWRLKGKNTSESTLCKRLAQSETF